MGEKISYVPSEATTAEIQAILDECGTIIFAPTTYQVDADVRLKIKSNSDIVLPKGCVVEAIPTTKSSYRVFNIDTQENITISGGGKIKGERSNHKGTDGEAGHGLGIRASKNIVVDNIEIFDCWGDCIFIQDDGTKICENVVIKNCNLHHARRSGIAVCGCNGFKSINNEIHKIFSNKEEGTMISYAIDFEAFNDRPNNDCFVYSTRIYDCPSLGITLGGTNNGVLIADTTVTALRLSGNIKKIDILDCIIDIFLCKSISIIKKIVVRDCKIGGAEINIESPNVEFYNCDFTPHNDEEMSIKFLSTGQADKPKKLNDVSFSNCRFQTKVSSVKDPLCMFYFYKLPLNSLAVSNCIFDIRNPIGLSLFAENKVEFLNNIVTQTHSRTTDAGQTLINIRATNGGDGRIICFNNKIDLTGVNNYYRKTREAMRAYAASVYINNNLIITNKGTGSSVGLSKYLWDLASEYNTKKVIASNNIVEGDYTNLGLLSTSEGFVVTENNNLYC